MGLFEWLFEAAVDMPTRKGPAGFEHCLVEIKESIACAKSADDKVSRPEAADDEALSGKRYKSRFDDGLIVEALRERVELARTFAQEVRELVRQKCENRASICYKRAGLSRQTYSHLVLHPGRGVSKDTALRIAIGLQLSYDEAVRLLSSAGYAFSAADATDAVFAYCLREKIYSIFDVNDLLVALGCLPLRID